MRGRLSFMSRITALRVLGRRRFPLRSRPRAAHCWAGARISMSISANLNFDGCFEVISRWELVFSPIVYTRISQRFVFFARLGLTYKSPIGTFVEAAKRLVKPSI